MMSAASSRVSLRGEALEHFERKDYARVLAFIDGYPDDMSDDHEILNLKARALDLLGRSQEALKCVDRCLEVSPGNFDDLCNRAALLIKLSRREEALTSIDQALLIQPKRIDTLIKRAQLLHNLGRRDDALQCAHHAVHTSPSDPRPLNMRGMILDDMERREEALADFLAILKADPQNTDAITNRGIIHGRSGEFREALACYDRSLSINPNQTNAIYNRAVVRLVLGDWRQGFKDFEIRWSLFPHEARRLTKLAPMWTGQQDLSGKTILLHHEQGYGDTLQFARYASLVKRLGAEVILAVPLGLKRVLESLPDSPRVVGEGEPVPAHDYHCPLMSLPLAFGTTPDTVPAPMPYLRADPGESQRWAERLGKARRPRIGVVWSGRQFPPINYARDMSLEAVEALFSLPADFICLHTDMPARERARLNSIPNVSWLGREFKDFADTAALIENLDWVISVDSAVAHLAGAMGKPVWLMNRYASCWRWLLERDDSPWYPTMRLFRQPSLGDWKSVVQAILKHATDLIGTRPPTGGHECGGAPSPTHARQDVLNILQEGLDQHNRGEVTDAMSTYHRVLSLDPTQSEALHYMGIALAQSGRAEDALKSLSRAVALEPTNAIIHTHYGNALAGLNRYPEAIEAYERAIECDAQLADSHYNCGVAWMALGREDLALACYDRAITLSPLYAQAHNNRGSILADRGEVEEALSAYGRAIEANPRFSDPLINRANLLRRLHRYQESLDSAERAIQSVPLSADAHNVRGAALADLGKGAEALDAYEEALKIDPSHPEASWNKGLIKLAKGEFQEGWALYEHRWRVKSLKLIERYAGSPVWTGAESVDGKLVLLHAEQGFGDTIQFCRYATSLSGLGARVILQVPKSLLSLLASVPGIEGVITQDSAPFFDLHCPLMSLPRTLNIDPRRDAVSPSYLKADRSAVKKWAQVLGPRGKMLRIGLAWAGRSTHANDPNRSISLPTLIPMMSPRIEWVSLQKEVRASDESCLATLPLVRRLGEELGDFADTAALIENLDLVITVDTAVAHLAGALGKPVLIFLPYVADWRWLRSRDDSPWYPSARLFRQSAPTDWSGPVRRVIQHLETHVRT
jgi:tetratricopeptide (TPR) repeat protein